MATEQTEKKVILGIKNGNLTCDPAVLHAGRNEAITFESQNGEPFSIQAKGISPLDKADLRSRNASVTRKANIVSAKVKVNVRERAEPGVYSFACAVYSDEQIYMDASCPSIIIE